MENEIKELLAIIVVLRKKIHELEKKVNGGAKFYSDVQWLNELRKEAQKSKF